MFNTTMNLLPTQYEMVRESREVLFSFCREIKAEHFTITHSDFGRGSIRNLLVHIANTYEFWIAKHTLHHDVSFTPYDNITDIARAESLFEQVNNIMQEFLQKFSDDYSSPLILQTGEKSRSIIPLKLFTHVVTHEFHHKGQLLSMSRRLGYTPIDTDIIR